MERRHHLAADHGPTVQGGQLTAHSGGGHGGGEAVGGQSSLWQGAGTCSSGDPEVVIAVAVKQWGKCVTRLLLGVFGGGKNRTKGEPGEAPPNQVAGWHGLPPGLAKWPPGQGVAPLWPSFGLLKSSVVLIFYLIFLDFSEHFYNWHFSYNARTTADRNPHWALN